MASILILLGYFILGIGTHLLIRKYKVILVECDDEHEQERMSLKERFGLLIRGVQIRPGTKAYYWDKKQLSWQLKPVFIYRRLFTLLIPVFVPHPAI